VRMLRAVGIEVLWTPRLTLESTHCPGEISLWRQLVQQSVSLQTSIATPSALDSSSSCHTDIDDCDCESSAEAEAEASREITTAHLLDERRGFYHVAIFPNSQSPSHFLSVETILPQFTSLFRSSPNPTADGAEQNCEATEFPIFLELTFNHHRTNSSVSVVPIPFSVSAVSAHRQGLWVPAVNHLRRTDDLSALSVSSKKAANHLSNLLNPMRLRNQQKQLTQNQMFELFSTAQRMGSCH
jgi:hypothetical protein